jgi:hypothetical protein
MIPWRAHYFSRQEYEPRYHAVRRIALLFGFNALLGIGIVAQNRVMLEAGGTMTQGAFHPNDKAYANARTAAEWGHGYQGGVAFLLGSERGRLFIGFRVSQRAYRQSVSYDTTSISSPSSFFKEEYKYNGTITAKQHALSIPLQLWLGISPRSRFILGADVRFAVFHSDVERGELTSRRFQYAVPTYELVSVTTTVRDYERNLSSSSMARINYAMGLGYRLRIGESFFLGPDIALVIPSFSGGMAGGPVAEGGLSLSWALPLSAQEPPATGP